MTSWRKSAARLRHVHIVLALALACFACRNHPATIEYFEGDDAIYSRAEFSQAERTAVQEIADRTVRDVRARLADLPKEIVVQIAVSKQVIPETGESGYVSLPNRITFSLDPHSPMGGALAIISAQLRPTLFHELHHMVRDGAVPRATLMDAVVSEGLAIAFERDFAGVSVPWGTYDEATAAVWVRELRALPESTPREPWLFRHPDGRRWVGLRAGTYLADRAMRASRKDAAELARMPTERVLALALGALGQ
jgi:uncharacterized protein YjaZ